MRSQTRFNVVCLVCMLAINAAFVVEFYHRPSSSFLVRALPVLSSNVLFLAMFLLMRSILARRDSQYQHLQRRYHSIQMVSEDQGVQERILEMLSSLSVEFLEKMQLGPLLERISQGIHEILRVDISVVEVFGESQCEATRFLRGAPDLSFSNDFYRDVIYQGKSLLVNKLSSDPQYASLARQGVESIVVAPLRLHGRAIGMIAACTRVQRGFTSRDLRLLYTFANHAALLVETTQLLHAVRALSVKGETGLIGDLRHLKEHLSSERQITEHEMEVARKIQTDLLPGSLPRIDRATLEGESVPAKEVGGDYYDVLDLGDGKWGIAIADVSGKGVPAALVMVMTRTLLHTIARASHSPAEVLASINANLYKETDPSVFVSMLYGIWDSRSGTFIYANAGHEPPILIQHNETMTLPSGGVALGAMQNVTGILEDRALHLAENDSLFLFTDGATEALNEQREMLGSDRLAQVFREAVRRPGAVPAVLSAIKGFTGNAGQHDDITIVHLNVQPQERS